MRVYVQRMGSAFMLTAEHGDCSASRHIYTSDEVPQAAAEVRDRLAEIVARGLDLPPRNWPDGVPYPIEEMP